MDSERRLRIAVQDIGGMLFGCLQDLATMQRWHPPSKRGMNYQRAMESLEMRLRAGEAAYQEALQKMQESPNAT